MTNTVHWPTKKSSALLWHSQYQFCQCQFCLNLAVDFNAASTTPGFQYPANANAASVSVDNVNVIVNANVNVNAANAIVSQC